MAFVRALLDRLFRPTMDDATWREDQHKRDSDGKFSATGGASAAPAPQRTTRRAQPGQRSALSRLILTQVLASRGGSLGWPAAPRNARGLEPLIREGLVTSENGRVTLTEAGRRLAKEKTASAARAESTPPAPAPVAASPAPPPPQAAPVAAPAPPTSSPPRSSLQRWILNDLAAARSGSLAWPTAPRNARALAPLIEQGVVTVENGRASLTPAGRAEVPAGATRSRSASATRSRSASAPAAPTPTPAAPAWVPFSQRPVQAPAAAPAAASDDLFKGEQPRQRRFRAPSSVLKELDNPAGKNSGHSVKDVIRHLTDGFPEDRTAVIQHVRNDESRTHISMEVVSPDGYTAARMTRSFNWDDKTVYHDYFTLAASDQGSGIGARCIARSVAMYQKMGLKSVGVHAALSTGGYAWAKMGFVPSQSSWDSLRMTLRGQYTNLGQKPHIRKILESENPKAIWALADSAEGKQMLRGSDWSGKLVLSDPQAVNRLNAHAKRKMT